ncbi:MAG: TIGR03905 family TSCPD domain-containing protein [Oscillospiraceae bacterium]|nr:TIGR03905 family TSCPD domain-containing protein [Oscillospiraceae bacterium]MDY3065335.1 TIGR03905 family TSCPD domain-containing protein [Oscillospiraceae bacterium]
MTTVYRTKGTCSRQIDLTIEEGIITDVKFYGGCNGNLQGISRLVIGQRAEDVAKTLKGVDCGGKGTSCPDQLAKAIEAALAQ